MTGNGRPEADVIASVRVWLIDSSYFLTRGQLVPRWVVLLEETPR